MTKQEKSQRIELVYDILAAIDERYDAHNNDIKDRYERGCLYGLLLAKSVVQDILCEVVDSEVAE